MLLINSEYYESILYHVKNSISDIYFFLYHDSFSEKVSGSKVDSLLFELQKAKSRGVKIKFICQNLNQLKKLKQYGFEVKKAQGIKTMHSKGVCIDSKYLFVGSHNFTNNAFSLNLEMTLLTEDSEDINKFVKYFKHCYNYYYDS